MNAITEPSKVPHCPDQPLPAEWSVRHGRDVYLEANGFKLEDYDALWTPASLMGIRFSVPNPPRHRWAIMLHDLHHIATGFGTDPAGEGQVSAWELGQGLRPLGFYVGAIVTTGFFMGLVVAPVMTIRAWRASKPKWQSLFHNHAFNYDQLLDLTIGQLRSLLGIPPEGLSAGRPGVHSTAPNPRT